MAESMTQLFRIAAITDEFSPDIEVATSSMAGIGMTGAELRMVFGKNIIDLSDDELDRAQQDMFAANHNFEDLLALGAAGSLF